MNKYPEEHLHKHRTFCQLTNSLNMQQEFIILRAVIVLGTLR